jgi:hypothetical protein
VYGVAEQRSVRARAAPEPNGAPPAESSAGLLNALDNVTQIAEGWTDEVWKRRWGADEDARRGALLRVRPLLFAKRLRHSDRTPYRQLRSLAINAAISVLLVLAVLAVMRFG